MAASSSDSASRRLPSEARISSGSAAGSNPMPSWVRISVSWRASVSGGIGLKSKRWQRESTVAGMRLGSVVASTNTTCGGGSSSVLRNALNAGPESMCTSSTTYTLKRERAGEYLTFSRSVRISSTPLLEAASISSTSTGAPETKSTHEGHFPQASGASPRAVHASALASRRAVVVFPTPRGPVNRYACATRPEASALRSVRVTASWPTTASKACGRHFRASTW